MKLAFLIFLSMVSCGSDDSNDSGESAKDERPILWTVEQIAQERQACSEIPGENYTQESIPGICYCIYQELPRIYTWDEYIIDIARIFQEEQKPLIDRCKKEFGEPIE